STTSRQVVSDEADRHRQNNPPVRLQDPAVQHRHDSAVAIEDGAPRGAGRSIAVDLYDAGQHFARRAGGEGRWGDDVAALALPGKVEPQRIAEDRYGVAALEAARVAAQALHARGAATDVDLEHADIGGIGHTDVPSLEPLLRARELHRDAPRRLVAVLADED